MARDPLAWRYLAPFGNDRVAETGLGDRAPGVERTTWRRIGRAWCIADEDNPLALPLDPGTGNRHRRQQCPGVRMLWMGVQPVAVGQLDDLPEVHDRDS